MKTILALLVALIFGGPAKAAPFDALALLQRDLGTAIEIISEREIRYCPDNTCDIFRIKQTKYALYLPSFVYLFLFHQGNYIYLNKSVAGSRPFRELAKNTEPTVRKQVESFCKEDKKTPSCILEGMKKTLDVTVTFGRYDEGQFGES